MLFSLACPGITCCTGIIIVHVIHQEGIIKNSINTFIKVPPSPSISRAAEWMNLYKVFPFQIPFGRSPPEQIEGDFSTRFWAELEMTSNAVL